jgi:hypothetical protein
MPEAAQATDGTQRPAERRRVPRVRFKATSVVTETSSSQALVAQTTQLSCFGCFVQTSKSYPKGARVHIEMTDGGTTFAASGVVAYVRGDGMGVVFSMVEAEAQAILEQWLSRTPRRSDRYDFAATAQLKELGSWKEQVLVTRDLSAGGCFVKTTAPLAKGSRVRIHIEHAGAEFTAIARVTDNVTSEGMGVEFIEMESTDRAILEKWLADENRRENASTHVLVGGLLLLLAVAVIAAIVLMIS